MMNRKLTIISTAIIASLISGSLAYATTVASSQVTACADKKSGVLRVASKCKSSEKSVPLISGSVQLAPLYRDANKKPVNVLNANIDFLGEVNALSALVNGKFVNVDAVTGQVFPIGSTRFNWFSANVFYHLQSDCSDTPFIWFNNENEYDARAVYGGLKNKKNYAGYIVFTDLYHNEDFYYKLSANQVAYANGVSVYQKRNFDGACVRNTDANSGNGYAVSGYTTIALEPFTGTKLPNFKGPITVVAQ